MVNTTESTSKVCPECRGRGKTLREDCVIVTYKQCPKCLGTGEFELQTGRIDIVRKSPMTGHLMSLDLTRVGYDVRTFNVIETYLEQLETPPDCIIAGYIFDKWYVDELFCGLAKRSIRTPVIICTNMDITLDELPQETYALFAGGRGRYITDPLLMAVKQAINGTGEKPTRHPPENRK